MTPNGAILPPEIETDLQGFVMTDGQLQTSLKGVLWLERGLAGEGATTQAASTAGEGATVALMIRQYMQKIGEA